MRNNNQQQNRKPKLFSFYVYRFSFVVVLSIVIYRGDMPSEGDAVNVASGDSSCLKEVRNVVASAAAGVYNASSSSTSKKYP